ncbi:MAG: aminotransferase class V-fold PLP-dependent enzyme, partial [Spirochaetaceae bacterium]|nr:aminotransferase class V-fold PLP-dependent enzyme [Spirochaetaceae bacterium]
NRDILIEAAELAASSFGNPSSKHALGLEAHSRLEEARARLAASLRSPLVAATAAGTPGAPYGSPSGRLVFTSGGSEADAMVLLSLLRKLKAGRSPVHVVSSAIEHSAVYEQILLLEGLGIEATFVPAGSEGFLDPAAVAGAVRKETALVAVMAVNNETGAVQPLAAIAAAVAAAAAALGRKPPRLHADAVQALGKTAFDPAALGLGSAAFSAHKLGGPRGAGALWLSGPLEPLAVGGGQESGLRPGTESLQGAWAFSRAAELAALGLAERRARALRLEARLLDGLAAIPGVQGLPLGRRSGDARYSPFILSASYPGLSGEVLARALADEGVAVSTGAACSANAAKKGRRVLDAMGLAPELSSSAIRVSTGPATEDADIDRFLDLSAALYRRLKP